MKEDPFRLWQIITTVLSSLLVLVGIIITIVHFNKSQSSQLSAVEKQIASQRTENKEQNRNNFQNAFWQQQLELYINVTSAAAELTQYELNSSAYQQSRKDFYTLFWGPMSIVEDVQVKKAMENFSSQLISYEGDPSADNLSALQQKSFQLARTCRVSSIKRWELKEFELD